MDPFEITRKAVIAFFLAFPLIMTMLMGFLGVGLGNMGFFILFLGQAIVVPLATTLLHIVTSLIPGSGVKYTDISTLVPSALRFGGPEINAMPSLWVAHVVFFFSYIFFNAYDIYNLPPVSDDAAEEWRVENRKNRTSMIMAVSAGLLLLMLLLRYRVTNAEKGVGILVFGLPVFGVLGYSWYQLARMAGAQRGDVVGIVQQMVPIAADSKATICIPSAA